MHSKHILTPALVLCSLAVPSWAQGGNDCASPTAIAGLGTFPINTTAATDSAQQAGPGCVLAHKDVWFAWTAAATGTTSVSLCGATSLDTVLAIYPGTACPSAGTQLVCNDDSCSLQSSASFNATSGNTYLFQLGGYYANTSYNTTFTVGAGIPGGCSTPTTGPDVIVGDITDTLNTTAAGGIDALALGTTSCNIGTQVISWDADTPAHPVIGGALYRYKVVNGSGRFEQLGQSWLKHGFAALTGSVCCACQNPGNSQILGVGCSDPYGSGLNGSQPNLGPRWQVNAHTGVFTYPPANPGYSGSTARRLEVLVSDLEPSSGTVKFYGECTYVTADDAAAGNNDNNTSYREMTVTGEGDFTFALTGSTQRMLQAIRAWPLAEPGVVLTDVHVAGDGLFIVGSHATNLGGGQYHYEFAVMNMNSDRNGGVFTVPIAPGTTVSNVGFRDVAYRNGDGPSSVNFTGTDWASSVGASSVSWACQTQAVNASANALRWGTTYNFRFDANAAPVSGIVTLGLWKTGSPPSATALAEVPGGAASTLYCFGDGSGTACPCGNNSAVGLQAGCLNSTGTAGKLTPSGNPSIGADTFLLSGSNMPGTSTVLYFQGTTQTAGGAGAVFGDGLRCTSGSVVRLGQKTNAGGASAFPGGGDPTVHVKGACAAGNVRTYQAWYRNSAAFCSADTFNLTNGAQTTWTP